MEKILITRLGAMGDIIHSLPAVAALRRGFPGAHISAGSICYAHPPR
jgi:ADP-heptose:LPS heptosyltransferase